MLTIYHSRGAFPARLAAAIQAGLLPAEPPPSQAGLEQALTLLGGPEALQGEGLWAAGCDGAGRRALAMGRASRPEVVHRAVHAVAELAGIDSRAYRLHNVGPKVAWYDLRALLLHSLRLPGAAHGAILSGLRRLWPAAARAAASGESEDPFPPPQPPPPPIKQRIIYQCYGSAHSSVTSANLHLGHLPLDRRPAPWDLLHQPLFDRAESHEVGLLRYMGADEWGNEIYVLGLAGGRRPMTRALVDFLGAFGPGVNAYRFEDTLMNAGLLLRIGGYASRGLGLVAVGRPLCALGVWLKYRHFAAHVRRVRREVALTQNPVSDIIG